MSRRIARTLPCVLALFVLVAASAEAGPTKISYGNTTVSDTGTGVHSDGFNGGLYVYGVGTGTQFTDDTAGDALAFNVYNGRTFAIPAGTDTLVCGGGGGSSIFVIGGNFLIAGGTASATVSCVTAAGTWKFTYAAGRTVITADGGGRYTVSASGAVPTVTFTPCGSRKAQAAMWTTLLDFSFTSEITTTSR